MAWSIGRVVEDDVGGLPAELQGQRLVRPCDCAADLLADLGRASERHLVDIRVLDEREPDLAWPGDDVHHARRQVCLAAHVREEECCQRGGAGGLQHDRVAGGQCRGDLPGQHQQREVPGDDLRRDTKRPGRAARERVFELVRPAGVVPEVRGDERDVDVARLLDRLAVVERLEHRELAAPLLQDPRDSEEVLGTLAAGQLAPLALERAARDRDRVVDVLDACPGNLGERFLRGRIDGGEPLAGLWRDLLAADEQPVSRLDRDDVARFGSGRVLPGDLLPVSEAPGGRHLTAAADERRASADGGQGARLPCGRGCASHSTDSLHRAAAQPPRNAGA